MVRVRVLLATCSVVAIVMAVAALAYAPGASAATTATCKTFDAYPLEGKKGRLCLYTAADYPGYKGVGFVGYSCLGVMPFGDGEPVPAIACLWQPPVKAWKWTSTGWVSASLMPSSVVVYPYSGTWRWVRLDGAWYAVQASGVTIRWFCPQGGVCRGY